MTPMIQRLYVDNFKTFVNFELTLGPLNLILGANGSGKSTFFEVVDRLRAFVYGEGKAYELFAPYTLTRWDTRDSQTFEIDCGVYRYQRTHRGPTRVSRISEDKGQGLPIAELVARRWLHGEPAN